MLINNKSLIKTINKLNLTDDEREKFNKISEDDKGNFLYNGKSIADISKENIIIDTYANIESIPSPYIGMIITVLEDETNSNKMTDYKVLSLKANTSGVANSVVDRVQRYVDYLGASSGGSVSQDDINTAVNNYLTENPVSSGATAEQAAQIQANKTAIGDENSGLIKNVNDIKYIEVENLNTAVNTLNKVIGYNEIIGDKNNLPESTTNIIDAINKISTSNFDGVLTSDSGKKFKLIVDESGNISTVEIKEILKYGNIIVSTRQITAKEGTKNSITVLLDSAPSTNQTITVESNNEYINISPSELTFNKDNYNEPQTININITENKGSTDNFEGIITLKTNNEQITEIRVTVENITIVSLGDINTDGISLDKYYFIAEMESNENSQIRLTSNSYRNVKQTADLYNMNNGFIKTYTTDDIGANGYLTTPEANTRYKVVYKGFSGFTDCNYLISEGETYHIKKIKAVIPSIKGFTRFIFQSQVEYINLDITDTPDFTGLGQCIYWCNNVKELHIKDDNNYLTSAEIFNTNGNLEIIDEETWWKREKPFTMYINVVKSSSLKTNYPDMPYSWGGQKHIVATDFILTTDGETEITELTTDKDIKIIPVTTPIYGDIGSFNSDNDSIATVNNATGDTAAAYINFGKVTLHSSGDVNISYTVNGITKSVLIHSTKISE